MVLPQSRPAARCLLLALLVALGLFSATGAHATPANFSYSVIGAGPTMTAACNNALAGIDNACDAFGPVTYNPGRCTEIFLLPDKTTWLCDCKATTTFCAQIAPLPH